MSHDGIYHQICTKDKTECCLCSPHDNCAIQRGLQQGEEAFNKVKAEVKAQREMLKHIIGEVETEIWGE